MKRILKVNTAIFLVLAAAAATFADVKITEKQTAGGQTVESTTYIKGERKRTESMNGAMVSITQCDARRDIRINPAFKSYSVTPFADSNFASPGVAAPAPGTGYTKGGTVTVTTTLKDTGERKQIFGYTARHILSKVVFVSSPDACAVNNTKIETDGWYIDDNFGFDCGDSVRQFAPPAAAAQGGCRDNFVWKTIGTAKKGYAVLETTRILNEDGSETTRMTREVTEISKTDLDAALFDIPPGYTEVSDPSELYRPPTATALAGVTERGSTSPTPAMPVPAADSSLTAEPQPIGEKRPGTIRIGITDLKVTSAAEGMDADDLAVAFRNTLVEYLRKPNVEVVLIEADIPSAVVAEAERLQCDLIVSGRISHKKGGGGFGKMFSKVIAPAIGSSGLGNTGSVAGNIAGEAAAVAVISAGTIAANTKAKDQMTFDVSVSMPDGSNVLTKQYKRKAKSDGDDLITPIVEEAATAIAAAAGS